MLMSSKSLNLRASVSSSVKGENDIAFNGGMSTERLLFVWELTLIFISMLWGTVSRLCGFPQHM